MRIDKMHGSGRTHPQLSRAAMDPASEPALPSQSGTLPHARDYAPMPAPGAYAPAAPPSTLPRPSGPTSPFGPTAEAGPPTRPPLRAILAKSSRKLAVLLVLAASYGAYRYYEDRRPYEWAGSVEARMVSVGSRAGGRVKEVFVHEGENVKAGTVLVSLEAGELEAQKALAEAEVEAAEAALDKLANGAQPDELAQADARLREARAAQAREAERAAQERRDLERTQALHGNGAISTAERDARASASRAAANQAAQASASAKAAEAALRLLSSGTRAEDLRVGRAQVAMAKARLSSIITQIDELSIRAPADVRVEGVAVRPGDLLRANATAATLLERGQLFVMVYIPEPQLAKVAVGQEVPVLVDAFPNRAFRGRIDHINDVGEFTPRRLTTSDERANEVFGSRVSLLEGEDELRAGMTAFIHVAK